MTRIPTTPETITDEQIRQLMTEAARNGDTPQVAICEIAISGGWEEPEDVEPDMRAILAQRGIYPQHRDANDICRAECARVIADAEYLSEAR